MSVDIFTMSLFTAAKSQSERHAQIFIEQYLPAKDDISYSVYFQTLHCDEGRKITNDDDYKKLIWLVGTLRRLSNSNKKIERICTALLISGMTFLADHRMSFLLYYIDAKHLDVECKDLIRNLPWPDQLKGQVSIKIC